jgi:hypothetical protein
MRGGTAQMPLPLNERSAISIDECQISTPFKGMPDVAPHRLHISRHYGLRSTARPVRKMGDM